MTAWPLFALRFLTVLFIAAVVGASWQNTSDLWKRDARFVVTQDAHNPSPTPQIQRRRVPVNRWNMVIASAALTLCLGVRLTRARRQSGAVAAMRQRGGEVRYTETGAPKYLRWLFGEDFFARPISMHFSETPVADHDLEHLGRTPGLQRLWLRNTSVTGAGLEHIQSLTKLQSLDLGGTQIVDGDLARLAGMKKLQRLLLDHTRITDDGLLHLKDLIGLRALDVEGTQVTQAGIDQLLLAMSHLKVTS